MRSLYRAGQRDTCTVRSQPVLLDFKDFGLSIGVTVPITSLVYDYTKVFTHNLNSKKTSGAAIGCKWMLSSYYVQER